MSLHERGSLVSKERGTNARAADDGKYPPLPSPLPPTRIALPSRGSTNTIRRKNKLQQTAQTAALRTLTYRILPEQAAVTSFITPLSSCPRSSAPISNISSSAGGGGTEHLASDQTPRQGRSQPAPKRQRGAAAAGEGSGPKASGEDNERSRRRLAAFLSRNGFSDQGGGGADARSLKSSAHEPSSPGGAQRWGNR